MGFLLLVIKSLTSLIQHFFKIEGRYFKYIGYLKSEFVQWRGFQCTQLCNQHHYLILVCFHQPKAKFCASYQLFLTRLSSQTLVITYLLSVSMKLSILDTVDKQNHTIRSVSSSFTQNHTFKVPLCIVYQYCILVPSWKICHCMDILHFVYLFFDWLTFECLHFHFLLIMSNTALNICIQVFVWAYVFISPGVEFLDHMVNLCLSFWETDKQFLKLAVPYCHCAKNVWGFQFYILINTCYCTSFLL